MNKYYGLIQKIADEFHIVRGVSESEERWKGRIIYSLLGRMAYASLSDHLEENEVVPQRDELVSITHFKRRIKMILDSYLELYPEVTTLFHSESENLCKEIYDIYLKSGCIYHTPYKISASSPCLARQNDVQFERGMPLSRQQHISGLGTYLPFDDTIREWPVYPSVQEMFGLQDNTLSEFWSDLISKANWQPLHTDEDMEYFNPVFNRWERTHEKSDLVSIARSTQPGNRLYFLYKINDNQMLGSQLPQWLVNDPFYDGISYRGVAVACLASRSCLPTIDYKIDGSIVQVKFQFLLPPTELYWIKLYSWPQSFFYFPSDFQRIFNVDVFQAVRTILEKIGYQFTEE